MTDIVKMADLAEKNDFDPKWPSEVMWLECNPKRIGHVIWLCSCWRLSRRTRWRRSSHWTRLDQTQPLFTLPKSHREITRLWTLRDIDLEKPVPQFGDQTRPADPGSNRLKTWSLFSTWNRIWTSEDQRRNGKTWSQTKSDSRYDWSSSHVQNDHTRY